MAQQGTNPKIEELRFRLKTDPKSRLFYQLAEELRKVKAFDEAEHVLRSGLTHNPTYLAAWVSLGRTLREVDKHHDAIDAFSKALQIDPGNAVAARLMADEYLEMGDKVEAIKKYKLCRALMPADEELDALIERLEDEINPVTILKPVAAEPPAAEPEPLAESTIPGAPPPPASAPQAEESPFASDESKPFAEAAAEMRHEADVAAATGDAEPMRQAHEESPFEEPAPDYTSSTLDIEKPQGVHVEPAPLAAEVPAPWQGEEPAAEVFEPSAAEAAPPAAPASADDVANTVTMADLYVQQGFLDRAQSIYESILDRDPNNDAVRAKLDALDGMAAADHGRQEAGEVARSNTSPKADRLAQWLAKVKRGEERRV